MQGIGESACLCSHLVDTSWTTLHAKILQGRHVRHNQPHARASATFLQICQVWQHTQPVAVEATRCVVYRPRAQHLDGQRRAQARDTCTNVRCAGRQESCDAVCRACTQTVSSLACQEHGYSWPGAGAQGRIGGWCHLTPLPNVPQKASRQQREAKSAAAQRNLSRGQVVHTLHPWPERYCAIDLVAIVATATVTVSCWPVRTCDNCTALWQACPV